MKHSKYNEYFNYMSGNGKANIGNKGKKNKDVSTLIIDFDEKLKYWLELLNDKYEEDENFYILRHEYNKLHTSFLNRENVMFSKSPIFIYKGNKSECKKFILTTTYQSFQVTNKQIVFHDFMRNEKTGEIIVLAESL